MPQIFEGADQDPAAGRRVGALRVRLLHTAQRMQDAREMPLGFRSRGMDGRQL